MSFITVFDLHTSLSSWTFFTCLSALILFTMTLSSNWWHSVSNLNFMPNHAQFCWHLHDHISLKDLDCYFYPILLQSQFTGYRHHFPRKRYSSNHPEHVTTQGGRQCWQWRDRRQTQRSSSNKTSDPTGRRYRPLLAGEVRETCKSENMQLTTIEQCIWQIWLLKWMVCSNLIWTRTTANTNRILRMSVHSHEPSHSSLTFSVMAVLSAMKYCLADSSDHTNLWLAFFFMPFGLFFDFFDGKVARWRQKSSLMGQELDSLADLVWPVSLIFHPADNGRYHSVLHQLQLVSQSVSAHSSIPSSSPFTSSVVWHVSQDSMLQWQCFQKTRQANHNTLKEHQSLSHASHHLRSWQPLHQWVWYTTTYHLVSCLQVHLSSFIQLLYSSSSTVVSWQAKHWEFQNLDQRFQRFQRLDHLE